MAGSRRVESGFEPGRRFIIVDTRVRQVFGGWWPRAGFDVTTDSRDAAESLVPLAVRLVRPNSSDNSTERVCIYIYILLRVIYYDHARPVVHGPAYRFLVTSDGGNFSIIDQSSSTHLCTR